MMRSQILLGAFGFVVSLLLAAAPARAATLGLGETTALPGQTGVGLPLSLTIASGEQVTAVSIDVHFDPLLTQWQSAALEPAVAALGKAMETSLVAPGHTRIVVYGLDRQLLSSGPVVQCLFQIPAAASGSGVIDLRDGLGSSPDGMELSMATQDGRVWIAASSPPPPEPSDAPAVELLYPTDGATVSPTFDVLLSVSGAIIRTGTGYTHLHLRLDGGSTWHVYNTKPFRLSNLKPGAHKLEVWLADNSTHKRISGDGTYQAVTFTVQ
jgi:hypothetical protein